MTETKETAAEAIRDIYKKEQQARLWSAIIILLLFAGIAGYCTLLNNQVELEKQWCGESSATEFVEQFESKCARYSSDPAIRARIDRIIEGKEK